MSHFSRLLLFPALALALLLSASAQSYRTLYNFTGGTDGNDPISSLTMDAHGNIYGTTLVGGAFGAGEVFQLHPSGATWSEHVVYSFTGGADGANPSYADVIFDSLGNLYGTTTGGGSYGLGTVFELSPTSSGWTEKVLYSFSGGADGANPYAGLLFDASGNLYGTTYNGGSSSIGTVFQLTPAADGPWNEAVIHTFQGTDGSSPAGGLLIDAQGSLYGVTQGGGAHAAGVVYQLTPAGKGWTENALYNFTGGSDGALPYAERLIFDPSGNLYGTTMGGGATNQGAVFRLSLSNSGSWAEEVLYSFAGKVAANPSSGVVIDDQGNLYGTCANGNGQSTVGAVFELSPTNQGWIKTSLHLFARRDGEFPEAALLRDALGNLYGTTLLGGTYNSGVVFRVKP